MLFRHVDEAFPVNGIDEFVDGKFSHGVFGTAGGINHVVGF